MYTRRAIILVVLFHVQAVCAEMPGLKAGNWDTLVKVDGDTTGTLRQICSAGGPFDPNKLQEKARSAGLNCSRNEVSIQGSVMTADTVCTAPNKVTVSTHTVTTFSGDEAYHSESHGHYEPAVAGTSDTTVILDAKWTGPCVPGQTPR